MNEIKALDLYVERSVERNKGQTGQLNEIKALRLYLERSVERTGQLNEIKVFCSDRTGRSKEIKVDRLVLRSKGLGLVFTQVN